MQQLSHLQPPPQTLHLQQGYLQHYSAAAAAVTAATQPGPLSLVSLLPSQDSRSDSSSSSSSSSQACTWTGTVAGCVPMRLWLDSLPVNLLPQAVGSRQLGRWQLAAPEGTYTPYAQGLPDIDRQQPQKLNSRGVQQRVAYCWSKAWPRLPQTCA
jgi:hypothetical protein